MRQFNFNALDERGEEHSGYLEAPDQSAVLQQLRRRGLYVLHLQEDIESNNDPSEKPKEALDEIASFLPVRNSRKIFFFKQLALMLRSGMSITEAFDVLMNMQKGRMQQITALINHRIKTGASFSSALEDHQDIFPSLAIQIIRSAETSGELDIALIRIANYMEHKAAIKKQVVSAMILPAFTLLAAIGVFVFLIAFIIPKFQELLERTGRAIPSSTQLMIDISEFFVSNWVILLVLSIISIIVFVVSYKKPKGRLVIDQGILLIPILGGVVSSAAMAQLSWGMSILLKSGIPVVDALRLISQIISNNAISKTVSLASESVLHGQDLTQSFDRPFITPLIHQLLTVGERSGNLVQIMEEANIFYEDDLKSKTKALASAVQPTATILIGSIVGFVYYGFFQALLATSTR